MPFERRRMMEARTIPLKDARFVKEVQFGVAMDPSHSDQIALILTDQRGEDQTWLFDQGMFLDIVEKILDNLDHHDA